MTRGCGWRQVWPQLAQRTVRPAGRFQILLVDEITDRQAGQASITSASTLSAEAIRRGGRVAQMKVGIADIVSIIVVRLK